MKKLTSKITSEFLSPAYSSPTATLPPWTDVKVSILAKYRKKLTGKLGKRRVETTLDEIVKDYLEQRIIAANNDSSLRVLQTQHMYFYRRWLAKNFDNPDLARKADEAAHDWYCQVFGMVKTIALVSQGSYPFPLLKSDFKNYRLKKYETVDLTEFITAVSSGRFPVTPELNREWNEKIAGKYHCLEAQVPNLEAEDIPKYPQLLERVRLFIRLINTLPPGVIRELNEIQAEATRLRLPLDYAKLIARSQFP